MRLKCLLQTVALTLIFCIPASGETLTHIYDDLGRLERTTYGDGTIVKYTYDEVGNRTAKEVYKPLAVDFTGTPLSCYEPCQVTFTDNTAGNPTSWSWAFGDGTGTSAYQNPSYLYRNPGSYTVSLTASNLAGTYSASKANYISVQACANQPVRISRTAAEYLTIQAAYNAALDGDVIQVLGKQISGDLQANRNVNVTITGGYLCNYSPSSWSSVMVGQIIVSDGVVNIGNIELK